MTLTLANQLISRITCNNKLSIIIPTYNEKKNIRELLTRIQYSLSSIDFELIVVDDNSPDGTWQMVEELRSTYGNLRVLKRLGKCGLSTAITRGFTEVTSESKVLAVLDADLQHPPELLLTMLEKIVEGYDIVVASRYVKGGVMEKFGLRRQILSRGATMLAHLFLPKTRGVRDVLSGFFMINRQVLDSVDLKPIGYKILLEILVKSNYKRVCEVPYTFVSRKQGRSNLGVKEIKEYLIHLSRLRISHC